MADGTERALGRLEADAATSQNQRAELFKQVGELREDRHKGFQEIRELLVPMASVPEHIKSHCDDLDKLNAYVQRFKGVMWSGRFVWAAVLVLAGAGWALFKEYKAENDTRINRIERSMPRSLYPDTRP